MSYVLKYKQNIFIYKSISYTRTLRAIVIFFSSNFFQLLFSDGKLIPLQLYWIIKGLIFIILSECLTTYSWLCATCTAYRKHLLSFLLIGFIVAFLFLTNQENIYMIHHDSDLFYDIYNRINEHNRRQPHYFSPIPLISIFRWIKKFLYNFISFIINHGFYVVTYWIHYRLLIIIYERNKFIYYC